MGKHIVDISKDCNHCNYRDNLSRHWDVEDFCSLNQKKISKINIKQDCPLRIPEP